MSEVVIRAEHLSKRYQIGERPTSYKTLRDTLERPFKGALRLIRQRGISPLKHHKKDTIWALKDVSFEIKRGEVLGIIGRNGAGKSTLLKILSRITEPTQGHASIRGRVRSLLEVGTGFHAELTGRENIYLNAAILGMKQREIESKFDEIVSFAEIEKFINTPVKYYSSGMYVRLAFAVAAHMDPEILLIDEVLAVGDASFQQKCLGRMEDISKRGRTVLFVSHNMAAIQNLCSQALVLAHGSVLFLGATEEGIQKYMEDFLISQGGEIELGSHPARRSGSLPLLKKVYLRDRNGTAKDRFSSGDQLRIELVIDPIVPLLNPQFGIGIDDWTGTRVFSLATYLSNSSLPALKGPCTVVCYLNELPLAPGRYSLSLSAGTPYNVLIDNLDRVVSFEVEPSDFYGNGKFCIPSLGRVLVRSHWKKLD